MKTTIEQTVDLLNNSLGALPKKKVLTEEKTQEKELSILEAIEKVIR